MRAIYLYHATSGQYVGQHTLQDDEMPFLEPGKGCTSTPAPTGQTLSEDYAWDGNVWNKQSNQ